jgi:hypothetical protein
MSIRLIYTLFIGVLIALFVGVGIAAFYPSPKFPTYPIVPPAPYPYQDSSGSAQYIKQQTESVKIQQDYQDNYQLYSRNVSIISLVAAILILVIGLTLFKSILLIADGLLLGAVLTLIYSIFRGFSSGDDKFRFIVVTIGLIFALSLGYIKFIKAASKKK